MADKYLLEGAIVDSYAESNSGSVWTVQPTTNIGQSFTGNGTTLGSGTFQVRNLSGATDGNIQLLIYAHSGTFGTSGVPTGSILATSDPVPISALTLNPVIQSFHFRGANQIVLANGTNYFLVVDYTGATSNTLRLNTDDTSPTHGGNFAYFNGTSWSADSTMDIPFYVHTATTDVWQLEDPVSVVDSYADSNRNEDAGFNNTSVGYGQSFTGDDKTLFSVQFHLSKLNSPTANAVAKIYAHSGTFGSSSVPTGAALATSDSVNAATLTSVPTLTTFTFSGVNKITLTNTTKYVVTMEYTEVDASFNVLIGRDSTSASHAGNSVFSTSGTWGADSSRDIVFYINGSTATTDDWLLDQYVELITPADAAPITDSTPTLEFVGTDPEAQDIRFNIQIDTSNDFSTVNLQNKISGTDAGFVNTVNGADTDPFTSGQQISYTVQSALTDGTYYWRVRGIDPSGSNVYSDWSQIRSFTYAASGTTVTPGVTNLVTASFAPTATATNHQTVVPPTRNVVTSSFAPTVTASDFKLITPPIAALTTSSFVPTVAVSDNQVVIPPTTSVVTSSFAPSVAVTNNQVVTPPVTALTTTGFVPTATASDHKTITPPSTALTSSTFAPTVTATDVKLIVPPTTALTTSSFAPTVTASNHQTVTPPKTSVVISSFAPTIITADQQTIVPENATLITTSFVPTVSITDHQVVTPLVQDLTLSTFAPSLIASDNQLVTPGVLAIALQAFPPTVTATSSGPQLIEVPKASLSLTGFVPRVRNSGDPRRYYIDSSGNVYWVVNQTAGLVEKI